MKREMLKELGLEDSAIDKIMAEVGKDISREQLKTEKVNQELENSKLELKSKEEMIANANSEIEKFKGLDVDGIKKQASEWENKYKEFENQTKADKEAYEKKLQDQQYDFAVKEFTGQHKFTNDFVKNSFIEDFKKQGLKLDDGKFLGADDYIKGFDEKYPGVFVKEAPPSDPVPEIVKPTGTGGQAPKSKMSLMEMMKMKNSNPGYEPPIGQ